MKPQKLKLTIVFIKVCDKLYCRVQNINGDTLKTFPIDELKEEILLNNWYADFTAVPQPTKVPDKESKGAKYLLFILIVTILYVLWK